MIRNRNSAWLLAALLASPVVLAAGPAATSAQAPGAAPTPATPGAPATAPAAPSGAAATATPAPAVMPPMDFVSSVLPDDMYTAIKATPAFAAVDKELAGSPLTLQVTHSVRPTAGGQAAGLLSVFLSSSTLGILPIVTNDRLVVKYEVRLNGRAVASTTFERTDTRAQSLWTLKEGLGKDGDTWVKGTAVEAAERLSRDPAMLAVIREIEYYFPAAPAAPAATATAAQN